MRVIFHPLALSEAIRAAQYYDGRSIGLGAQFLDKVDEIGYQIELNPERFESVGKDVRRATVNRFPYSVFFRVANDEIKILQVKHPSQNSAYWRRRR
jgi:hypothetical protein